jgi:hypothetical protein
MSSELYTELTPPPPVFFDGGTGLFDGGGNPDP